MNGPNPLGGCRLRNVSMSGKIIKKSRYKSLLTLLICFISWTFGSGLIGSCDQAEDPADNAFTAEGQPIDVSDNLPAPGGNPVGEAPAPPAPSSPNTLNRSVQNVILVVGSGMGPSQVGQIVQYRRLRLPTGEKLALERLMEKKYMGMVSTHSYLDIVSDSAAANSAMTCGHKSRNNTVGMDANGHPCETILEKAAALGKATGLVTNTKLSHPGVSAHGAHRLIRQEENEISMDLLENKNIDVILAGGLTHLIPQGTKMSDLSECSGLEPILDGESSRTDSSNLIGTAKEKGYQFACNLEQLNNVETSSQTKLLGIFANKNFPLSPDRQSLSNLPSLAQMTDKALATLALKENGFFLVIHNGLTHAAARDNDAGSLLQEGLNFDAALQVALNFTENNPNTLLVVTADHETAGFAFSSSNQNGADLDLPSGDHYEAPFNYAPFIRFDLLADQQKSFGALTKEILDKLYGESPELSLELASEMLVTQVEAHTPFQLSLAKAQTILERAPGKDNAQTQDFKEFYIHNNVHANLLGRAVAKQTSTVWSSGTPTSTPVMIMALGPEEYANRVRGFIDNTEIAKIINDAFLGH